MRVPMTEYLEIDLERERWLCRRCGHDLAPARANYKEGTLVHDRDPREIHRPLIDPDRYEFTFAPDPAWCRILEFCCPSCGTMIEVEYLPRDTRRRSTWRSTSTRSRRNGPGGPPAPTSARGPDVPPNLGHSHAH